MATVRRQRLRAILEGDVCVHPASVFDPVSARIAEGLGFEAAMLAGSVASAAVLGAPDVAVLTATELAGLCHRITRANDLPLVVDADHGFGNALNVMRTVEELEAAGVAALTLEDTALPEAFGPQTRPLTGQDEMIGRLTAAIAARRDPALVIIGRTGALRHGAPGEAVVRARAYEAAGVDAIFIAGARSREEILDIRAAVHVPVMLGIAPTGLADRHWLGQNGISIAFLGHTPFQAAMQTVYESMHRLLDGASPEDIAGAAEGSAVLERTLATQTYDQWRRDFLGKN